MDIVFEEAQLDIMRGIKKTFDPNNILNSGKIFDHRPRLAINQRTVI
jgi:glycolate oxidase